MTEFEPETIKLYFKQVYTCKTKEYRVNYNYTLAQLYDYITPKAFSDDFGIDQNSYKIEIVEAGQFDNVNGRDAELAPALDPNEEITLRNKYGDDIKHKAFYIRPVLISRSRRNVLRLEIPTNIEEDDNTPLAPRS